MLKSKKLEIRKENVKTVREPGKNPKTYCHEIGAKSVEG
jgi:hypothetical protein